MPLIDPVTFRSCYCVVSDGRPSAIGGVAWKIGRLRWPDRYCVVGRRAWALRGARGVMIPAIIILWTDIQRAEQQCQAD
jgi:hypothetical protein